MPDDAAIRAAIAGVRKYDPMLSAVYARGIALAAIEPAWPQPTDGAERIAAERRRQVEDEGWTAEHDAEHDHGELTKAAMAYLWFALGNDDAAYRHWPFDGDMKNVRTADGDVTRTLVKAGALIAAEIDRIAVAAAGASLPAVAGGHANLPASAGSRPEPAPEAEIPNHASESPSLADALRASLVEARAGHAGEAGTAGTGEVVHLVGQEDDENACGLEGPNAAYWRKVTCPDCIALIQAAEQRRKAGTGGSEDPSHDDTSGGAR